MTLSELKRELRYATEGLEQMQQPEAGYFEDFNNKQPHEMRKFNEDMMRQLEGITRLERRIAEAEKKEQW